MEGGKVMGYSQFGEESIALGYFSKQPKPVGRFRRLLDIGAHDGITYSNSRRLIELGWGGTLVEPSPKAFATLFEVYKERPDINLVNVGLIPGDVLTPLPLLMEFHDGGGNHVGTFDPAWRDECKETYKVSYRPIYVSPSTFGRLITTLRGPYDFISIDVEGINFDLFRSATPFLREVGCEMICVEHQGRQEEISAVAHDFGYVTLAITTANIVLVRA